MLSGSRSQSVSHEDSCRWLRQSVCQLHSCWHPHQSRSLLVSSHSCRTPFSQRCHRQCRSSIFRHARVFGQTVEHALTVSDHSDGQVLLSPHSSGKTLPPITTSHNIARVYSAKTRASRHALASAPKVDRMVRFRSLALPSHERYWNGISFLQIVLSHHTDQRPVLGALVNHSSSDPSSSGSALAL